MVKKSLRILIVDNDANLRTTLFDILKIKGYAPISVSQGKEALVKVAEEIPAVALIDLKLVQLGGSLSVVTSSVLLSLWSEKVHFFTP